MLVEFYVDENVDIDIIVWFLVDGEMVVDDV